VGVVGDDLKRDHDFKGDLHLCDIPTTLAAVAQAFLEEHTDKDVKELSSKDSDVSKHKYTKLQKLIEELPHNDGDVNDTTPENRDDSTRSLFANREQEIRLTKAQKKFDECFKVEANVFCSRLAWRLKTNELMDIVKVIEIKRLAPDEQDTTTE